MKPIAKLAVSLQIGPGWSPLSPQRSGWTHGFPVRIGGHSD